MKWFVTSDVCPVCRTPQPDDPLITFRNTVKSPPVGRGYDGPVIEDNEVTRWSREVLTRNTSIQLGPNTLNRAEEAIDTLWSREDFTRPSEEATGGFFDVIYRRHLAQQEELVPSGDAPFSRPETTILTRYRENMH